MKRTLLASLTLAAFAFSANALANATDTTPDFSYVEVGYGALSFDDSFLPDADVLGIQGSWEFSEMGYARLSYADADYDDIDSSADQFTAGLGLKYPLTKTTALFGDLNYFHVGYDYPGFSESFDGYQVNTGVKSRIMPELELTGTITYTDISDLDDGMEVTAGARYFFTDEFALGLDYSRTPDSDLFFFVGRYSF